MLLDEKAGIPKAKTYAVVAFAVLYLLLLVFNVAGSLLTNLLGFLYPAYQSYKAIESTGKEDDTQWLTYWTVFGFFNVVETWVDILLQWLPFYWLIKTAIILYLALPQLRVLLLFIFFMITLLSNHRVLKCFTGSCSGLFSSATKSLSMVKLTRQRRPFLTLSTRTSNRSCWSLRTAIGINFTIA